jgi:non-heme chloroperoxidase
MSEFIADDGETIHLKISGDGPPLVMLHGWTSDHREWFPFLHGLEPQHRIYRWDARGHGGHLLQTKSPPTVQRMARDLENLLEHYQLKNVVAVGHSMGALTLWQYLREYGSARFAKLCFIDQSPRLLTDETWPHGIYGGFDIEQSGRFLDRLREDFAEAVLELIAFGRNQQARQKYLENAVGWQKSRNALKAMQPEPLIRCWESLIAADFRDVLPQIEPASLLIYGGESNFYSRETAEHVAQQIRNSTLHIYENTDHSPHMWKRERFVQDLLNFNCP